MEIHSEADNHPETAALGKLLLEYGPGSLQKDVRSGAGFADRSCDPVGDSVPEGLHPEGGTHAGTFLEENTHGEVHEELYPMCETPMLEQEKNMRRKKQQRVMN